MIWAKSGPFLTWKSWVFWSTPLVPIRSAGRRSGVNWMREKLAWMISERVRTARVLARPGTPSSRMWPPVSIPTSSRSTMASCPTIRRDTSLRMRGTGSDSAGLSVSFGALTLANSVGCGGGKLAGVRAGCHVGHPRA
jgi:hypothetical protein